MDRMTGGSPRVEVYRGPARLLHWLTVLLVAVQIPVGLSMFPALDIFGLFTLPGVVAPEKDVATVAFRVHRALVFALVSLIVMHVAAVLHHDVVRKDNVLGRMIPSLLRR